mgnify:CR=1 FL=1
MANFAPRCYNRGMSNEAVTGWARDADIRESLKSRLREDHAGEADVLLVEEMGLCQGEVRIDLGIINGQFIGYEIKSPRDTLERLPGQAEVYSRTLDQVTVVTCERHLAGVTELVPDWWGIEVVGSSESSVRFDRVREAQQNPSVDPAALVQLLWRHEVLSILIENRWDRGVRTKPKQVLWNRLVESVEPHELHLIVRNGLKAREDWKVAQPLA